MTFELVLFLIYFSYIEFYTLPNLRREIKSLRSEIKKQKPDLEEDSAQLSFESLN